jgi:hypothetical protein
MKAFLFAAVFATLTTQALAGATRDSQPLAAADRATAVVLADAGRLGSASLTALNGSHWNTAERRAESDAAFDDSLTDIDTGTLIVGITAIAFLLVRPLSRALRRQEQQRRATALASTLHNRT